MTEVLATRRGSRVTGIELDPDAAAQASAHCERVIVGDAETLDLAAELGDERFDAVLFADVLEHLRDPAALLRRVRRSSQRAAWWSPRSRTSRTSASVSRCSAASSGTASSACWTTPTFASSPARASSTCSSRPGSSSRLASPPHRARGCGDPPDGSTSPPSSTPRFGARSGGHDLPVRRLRRSRPTRLAARGRPQQARGADVRESSATQRELEERASSSSRVEPTKRRRATSWPSGSLSRTRSPSSTR